ncbi:MAG: HD-GYP domain-containing protein [Bacillota bacterium]
MSNRPIYSRVVAVADLKPGDFLAQDIELGSAVLISAGAALTSQLIDKLKDHGLETVRIDIGHLFDQSVARGKVLLQKAADGIPITKAEVRTLIQPLVDEVLRDTNIARVLTQLQSLDDYTYQHSVVIGVLACVIGHWLGYDGEVLVDLSIAGALHDIGKALIPNRIISKPGPLSDSEFEMIKQHPSLGSRILADKSEFGDEIRWAVIQHHERFDGSGYPQGLKGEQIHLYGRILAVADVYHAMTSKRSYKDRISPYLVLEHLSREIGRLDSTIVWNFTHHMLDYLMGCRVRLSNGRIGDVVYIDPQSVGSPLVKVEDELIDLKQRRDLAIDEILP